MKKIKLFSKISAVLSPRPKKRLQATARAARRPVEDYEDEEEPTTKLSSAFIVVLILHVVAVGGIYAFNSIKAARKDRESLVQATEAGAPTSAKNPATGPAATSTNSAPAHLPETPATSPLTSIHAANGQQYTVRTGDNITRIAFAYGVTSAEILAANHLKDGTAIHPGQTITIPPPKAATAKSATTAAGETHKTEAAPKQADVPPTATTPGFYTVKRGDTATSIARNYGLTAEELLKANRITDPKKLQPGQTLKVPARHG